MKSGIRLTLFALVLLLTSNLVKAQDKYEFMTISYVSRFKISVSIDGTQLIEQKVILKTEEDDEQNANPFLLKVKEYQNKGWEVMTLNTALNSSSTRNFVYVAYLRKKKV